MAKHVLKTARIEVNGTNLSDHVRSVTIGTERDEIDVTAMGAANKEFIPGLGDVTIEVEFYNDYAASSVDPVLWPLSTSDTPFVVKVRPTSAAISATNPEYSLTALLYNYSPIAGTVGEANTTTVTFRNAAQAGLTKATS
jgi:hypothetical protein